MDIGKPLLLAFIGFLAWLIYSAVIAVFPGQLKTCFRLGKTFIWRSLLNGVIAYAAVAAILFAALSFSRTPGIISYLSAAGLLSIAGCSVGFMLLGSLFDFIDATKNPYQALAAGIAVSGAVNSMSGYGEVFTFLVGAYGLGAIILNIRGMALDLPPEPADQPGPASYSPVTPLTPGKPGGPSGFRTSSPGAAESRGTVKGGEILLAALSLIILFFAVRYVDRLAKTNVFPETSNDAGSPAASPSAAPQQQPPQANREARQDDPLADLKRKAAEIEWPTIDLDARMWAYRIQNGEFTAETLKGYSENWIISEDYKTALFRKIDQLLKSGPVTPLTKTEHDALRESTEKASRVINKP